WRSILWSPTWFIFAFLRRLATLEAAISLPVRPFPARAPAGQREEPAAAGPASVLFEAVPADEGWAGADWAGADWHRPGPDGLRQDDPGQGGPEEDPVPIPTRLNPSRPRLLLPEDDWRPGDG
ncbi:MAG: hypothetical protein QOG05_2113, partial [Streptosporangiaceae bacterium]|nr:hypothetical protein [Streptosporangiaceae bacterium]